jgi:integrase/recombinase XerD
MTPLRQHMLEDMRLRNFSPHTQESYLLQITQFARYFAKSPEVLGPAEIRTYQLYQATEKKLAPRSIQITASALRFLYKVTLKKPWVIEDLPTPRKPQTLPVVLSQEEVTHFLESVHTLKQRTILTVCYAAGLRIAEVTHLKITDIDSQRMVIRVEQGKGHKDRYVMLSPALLALLRTYWKAQRPRDEFAELLGAQTLSSVLSHIE